MRVCDQIRQFSMRLPKVQYLASPGFNRNAGTDSNCLRQGVPELVADVLGLVAELLLDAKHLVILGGPLASAGGAGLDLASAEAHHEVSDEAVLRLSATMRHHGSPAWK